MVRLIRSWRNKQGRIYPIGTVLKATNSLSNKLIEQQIAEEYNGVYPPKKMRTEFFNPNKNKNGKNNW